MGPYVLDFYCPAERLAIELDGAHHYTTAGCNHDDERTRFLSNLKIEVLRFENKHVISHLDLVAEEIRSHFKR